MATEKRLIDANAIKYTEYRGGGGRDYPENIVTEDEICRMPTVDAVEVVHGKWVEILTGQNSSGYECSICKRIISVVSDADLREKVLVKKYPYCHCGAKMDGGVDRGL